MEWKRDQNGDYVSDAWKIHNTGHARWNLYQNGRLVDWQKSLARCKQSAEVFVAAGGYDAYTRLKFSIQRDLQNRIRTQSGKQQARQRARDKQGHYEAMLECELCGKRIGSEYCSDRRVDTLPGWGGIGLCLCDKCCNRLDKLPDDEALKLLTGH